MRQYKMRVLVFRTTQQLLSEQFPYRAGCLEMQQYKMRVLVFRTAQQAAF